MYRCWDTGARVLIPCNVWEVPEHKWKRNREIEYGFAAVLFDEYHPYLERWSGKDRIERSIYQYIRPFWSTNSVLDQGWIHNVVRYRRRIWCNEWELEHQQWKSCHWNNRSRKVKMSHTASVLINEVLEGQGCLFAIDNHWSIDTEVFMRRVVEGMSNVTRIVGSTLCFDDWNVLKTRAWRFSTSANVWWGVLAKAVRVHG